MPPTVSAGRPARAARRFVLCAVAALDLTCAQPIAAGPPAGDPPTAPRAAAAGDAGPIAPLPARPKPIPMTEHTELRAPAKTIARHVERGFETLVMSTADSVRCDGERHATGAEV